jgi:hypothetical protein
MHRHSLFQPTASVYRRHKAVSDTARYYAPLPYRIMPGDAARALPQVESSDRPVASHPVLGTRAPTCRGAF